MIATLRGDGNVLIPVDAAGRVLEVALLLEEFWVQEKCVYLCVGLSVCLYAWKCLWVCVYVDGRAHEVSNSAMCKCGFSGFNRWRSSAHEVQEKCDVWMWV